MKSTEYVKCVLFSLPIIVTPLFLSGAIMSQPFAFILSIAVAFLLDFLWWQGFAGSKYDRKLEMWEHYHHAIWLSMLALIFLRFKSNIIASMFYGFALVFWADECAYQKHKFAIGSNHEQKSDEIGLSIAGSMVYYFDNSHHLNYYSSLKLKTAEIKLIKKNYNFSC